MPLDELRALIARHARENETTAIDGVLVSIARRPSVPTVSTSGTCLALVAQGAKRLVLGERVFDYRAGQYLVASVDLPVTGRYTEASPAEPALGFGLVLRSSVIAELLLDPAASELPRGDRRTAAPPGIAVSAASFELIDAVVRLLRLLDRPRDLSVLAPMIEREILWLLITGEQGATVRQLGLADSRLTDVNRTVRWIREHYTETIRVDQLAQLARMSTSAFHRSFQAVTTMSPIRFQKQLRLHEARLLLVTRPGDVAGVGHAVGYDSASQFSREYRRHFGVPPGQDGARLRTSI